jgi:hypothetical protein
LLNAIFLERAPKDPPPPRRSRRSLADNEDQSAESNTPTKKAAAPRQKGSKQISPPSDDNDDVRLQRAVSMLNLSSEDVSSANDKPGNVKQRKRVVRNVGGWISPQFSKELDRAWLMVDGPTEKFDLSTYVPQVGDTVL